LNNASNKNGIYSLKMKVNGHYVYHHDLETFAFKNSKYINLFIDYPHYARFKNKFQKTYIEKGNQLKIYKTTLNNGFIDIKNGYDYTIELIASDFKGNETSIKIPVKGVKSNTLFKQVTDTTAYKIIATQFHKFEQNGVTIAFPKNTFYKDVYLDFNVEKGLAKIHKPYIPLNKNYTLTFDVSKFTEEEKRHLYIANINNKKYPSYTYTKKKENKFYTTTKTLGNYTLKSDSQKPTIVLKNFNHAQWINKHTKLIVKIDDIGTGIKSFRATIDTKWVLMEYNLKQKTVTYDFNDTKLVGTKHDFKIEVEDRVGNTNTLNATFYKKQ
jgi:hypothetical protein